MSTIHVRPGEGRHYPMIDGDHIAKAAVKDACGTFEVFEVVAPASPMAPPHVSPWTGVLFLLEGRITALVDGTSYDVEPGGVVVFPAGTPSTFEVVGQSARFVAITSGDGAGRFFDDFSTSVPAGHPVEDSMAAILSVTARHGVALGASEPQRTRGAQPTRSVRETPRPPLLLVLRQGRAQVRRQAVVLGDAPPLSLRAPQPHVLAGEGGCDLPGPDDDGRPVPEVASGQCSRKFDLRVGEQLRRRTPQPQPVRRPSTQRRLLIPAPSFTRGRDGPQAA